MSEQCHEDWMNERRQRYNDAVRPFKEEVESLRTSLDDARNRGTTLAVRVLELSGKIIASEAARVKAEAGYAEMSNDFLHIIEYWNRSENDCAMNDALYHILDVSEAAVARPNPGSHLLERLRAADELARNIGKLFHEQGEDFRLNSPEALDAYLAYESLKGGGE